MVNQWLADVTEQPLPVICYRTHPAWELDWTGYGDRLSRFFP